MNHSLAGCRFRSDPLTWINVPGSLIFLFSSEVIWTLSGTRSGTADISHTWRDCYFLEIEYFTNRLIINDMEINEKIRQQDDLFELVDSLKTEIEKLNHYKEQIQKSERGSVPSIMRKLSRRISDAKRRFDLINGVFEESKVTESLIEALRNEANEELNNIRDYYDNDLGLIEKIGVDAYCLSKDEIITNAEQIGNYLAHVAYILFRAAKFELDKDDLIKLKAHYVKDVQSGVLRASHEMYKEALYYCDLYDIIEMENQEKLLNEVNKILGVIK